MGYTSTAIIQEWFKCVNTQSTINEIFAHTIEHILDLVYIHNTFVYLLVKIEDDDSLSTVHAFFDAYVETEDFTQRARMLDDIEFDDDAESSDDQIESSDDDEGDITSIETSHTKKAMYVILMFFLIILDVDHHVSNRKWINLKCLILFISISKTCFRN